MRPPPAGRQHGKIAYNPVEARAFFRSPGKFSGRRGTFVCNPVETVARDVAAAPSRAAL